MQGFALKESGSGLKSLVHAARGAPQKYSAKCYDLAQNASVKMHFLGKCGI